MDLVVRQDVISGEAAHKVVGFIVARGREMGRNVTVAVVDPGGHLVAFLRNPAAAPHTVEIAQDKAFTAASFKVTSAQFFDRVKDRPSAREALAARKGIAMMRGGVPIIINGMTVGGVGVSGAPSEEDEQLAYDGLAAIGIKPPV